jgi:hypothetical protein
MEKYSYHMAIGILLDSRHILSTWQEYFKNIPSYS